MGKVKILVVEDEIVIADNICEILEGLGYEVVEPVINYTEAVEALEIEKPDLVLLDIQLAGSKDGIDLAWRIKEDFDIPFIFLTSNADPRTVGRAKELSPPAYLVKPFNRDDLYTSIEMALHNFGARTDPRTLPSEDNVIIKNSFFIKDKNLYHKAKISDILFIKSEHVYVELYMQNGKKHLIRSTMNDFVESLPKNFFRTHRSYTINLDYLDTINSRYVIIHKEEIPIGKNYRDDLMRQISIR